MAFTSREPIAAPVLGELDALLERRVRREPLQHLTGRAPFRQLDMAVGPGVFIPRPETESVAEVAIAAARAALADRGTASAPGRHAGADVTVVDLCTGSGAIALSIASEVPGSRVWAVELDATAFAWAQRNLAGGAIGLSAPAREAVTLLRGDARLALPQLDGTVDVVVSNPPYVPGDAVPREVEVAAYDPPVALYGLGGDGLEVPRGIVAAAARLLRPGGIFVMEHAEVQAEAVQALLGRVGAWEHVETRADLNGQPRMVVATRTPGAPVGAGRQGQVPDVSDGDGHE